MLYLTITMQVVVIYCLLTFLPNEHRWAAIFDDLFSTRMQIRCALAIAPIYFSNVLLGTHFSGDIIVGVVLGGFVMNMGQAIKDEEADKRRDSGVIVCIF